jgi:hypothetical protein
MRKEGLYKGFWWGTPERKTQSVRPRLKLEDNIKINLQEMEWESMDWIDLAQDRNRWQALLHAVMNFQVP